jgi:biopolymer transport protein ExbB/TolQ
MALWLDIFLWISRLTLLLLAGLSVWSVALILEKRKLLGVLESADDPAPARAAILAKDWSALKKWSEAHTGLRSGAVQAALAVSNSSENESVDRAVESYLADRKVELDRGMTVLASLGSNAPFIGLFGTVLGIIQAFGTLSGDLSGSTQGVMVTIAEALIATAVGLFVAIPAVLAYNGFSRRLKNLFIECESLRDLYLSRRAGT